MAETLLSVIEGLQRMIEPLSLHDFHQFREVIANMTGDDYPDREAMVNAVGSELSAELASSIERLAQRSLMTG